MGGATFLFKKEWSNFLQRHSISFAAGVLITVSIVGLLPEAYDILQEDAFIILLVTFFAAYLFENLLFDIHHHSDDHPHQSHYRSSVFLVIVGDTIHNFIDGVAIGASFVATPSLGIVTALSTFLHEVPHEVGDFGILLKAGWKKWNILWVNIISAAFTIVGAFLVFVVPESPALIGTFLAISSGIFLYLGASDFLPDIGEGYENKAWASVPLLLGVVTMLATLMLVPHSH